MRIHKFSPQLQDIFRKECDFTDFERQCFEYKVERYTDYRIAAELFISESTVAKTMHVVRNKIFDVMQDHLTSDSSSVSMNEYSRGIVCHTMEEWAKIPDYLSAKGVFYVYLDYRTENDDTDIPRIKVGDGIHSLSELHFATMSISDSDIEYWDSKPDMESDTFGKVVEIDSTYSDHKFVCPTDGYIMLEFENANEYAKVKIFGKSEQTSFTFEKLPKIDIHSKEVFVRKGMKCLYQDTSKGAKIQFIPSV